MLQFIHEPLARFADLIGLPVDPFKIIVCLLLSYPLAGILKRLPDDQPRLKNIFNIATGLFFLVGIFDLWGGIWTLFVSCAGTWLLCKYVQSPFMPWINFVFIMGHMSLNQIRRQMYGDDEIVDITGAQMVLVMKLTAFAWNVQDGRTARRAQGGLSALADFQRESALTELPDLLSYAAWALFFPSMLIGPAFEFAQYKAWLECSIFNVDVPKDTKAAKKMANGRRIPRSGGAATRRALQGIFWLFCYTTLVGWFNLEYVVSAEFRSRSLLYRLFYIMPLAFTHRAKYYGIWKLSEGACILAGFGFNGVAKSGAIDWSAIENIDPWSFEKAQNTKALLEAWNKNTNKWLKNYVYLRVTPKGKKPGFVSTLATFSTSAIWHGFYPGYHLAFATGALAQTMGKLYRRNFRPFFLQDDMKTPIPAKQAYDIVCWFVTQWSWAYIVQPFVMLSFMGSLKVWSRFYFLVHIGIALNLAFFNSPAVSILKSKLKAKSKRYEALQQQNKLEDTEDPNISAIPTGNEQMKKELREAQLSAKQNVDAKVQQVKQKYKK